MRLFIAIPLNGKTKQLTKDMQQAFRRSGVRGNYAPEENLHVTLAFIGEYSDPDAVLEALENVSFRPFTLTMDKAGSFDDLWWAGFAESRELEKLAGSVRRALANAGIPFDKKRFRPHVTFLRRAFFKDGRKIIQMDITPAAMQVTGFSLMRSDRGKNGMIYTEVGYIPAERTI